ncbi:DUF3376 domain-containing protein [Actinomycetospora lutea]|uniref:DUF3376 domain-containing protein n=1 Tax=Actinomycetospora lutea TaxID=663604 RepID=UPI002365BF1E|nr:DUF3376 domain-containing protein [Actinomycetospora lutea]MDD7942942.1 DUF3376 domain-containing protein [Actinomycetospora lutea]
MTERTVRLALVMNGGISLAVWMGGVARELDIAARASTGRTGGVSEEDLPHYEMWEKICAGTKVEIDIIAGTSAGGLNGTLLATSQALSSSLPSLKEMWRESARIEAGHLLPPNDRTSSILDGQYFAQKARETLDRIKQGAGQSPAAEGAAPTTLFVTSTALGEHYRSYRDSFDQHFDAADHRRVYRFRSTRPDGGSDFETSFDALSHAARASAGFPVAFEPVPEGPELQALARGLSDGASWLIDGGVLDNSPFGPVLDEILQRHVESDLQRIIAYIVPSNGKLAPDDLSDEQLDQQLPDRQPAWTKVLGAAFRFPSESDFRGDIESLAGVLGDSATQRGASAQIIRALLSEANQEITDALYAAEAALYTFYAGSEPLLDRAALVYRVRSRTGWSLPLVPASITPGKRTGGDPPEDLGELGHAAAERMVRLLLADLRERLARAAPAENLAGNAGVISDALASLVSLREVMEDGLASGGAAGADLDRAAGIELDTRRRDRSVLIQKAVEAYAATVAADMADVRRAVRATEIVMQAVSPRTRPAPPPFQLLRIGPDTPSEFAPGSFQAAQHKLYGTQMGHFGAFGDPEWRDWDWAWGRLDAAATLANALRATPQQIRDLQASIWVREGAGDINERLSKMMEMPDGELRRRFADDGRLDSILGSFSRFLRADHPGQPGLVTKVGPWVATMIQPNWTIKPHWYFPGGPLRRWIRKWFN